MRKKFMSHVIGVLVVTLTSTVSPADELHVERFGMYLRVNDLDESRAFYERVLGKQPYVANHRLVGFDIAGGLLALYGSETESLVRGRNVVPYIRVANADAEFERLKRLGAQMLDEQVVTEGPLKLFRFVDPDGNMLEIFSLTR